MISHSEIDAKIISFKNLKNAELRTECCSNRGYRKSKVIEKNSIQILLKTTQLALKN